MKNYLNVLTLAALTALFLSGCAGQQQGKGLADISADVAAVELDADANGGVDIGKGGTNATTAANARTNLGLGASSNVGFGNVNSSTGALSSGVSATTRGALTLYSNVNSYAVGIISAATPTSTWSLVMPPSAPGGDNYLFNVDADGTGGWTDPATLGGDDLGSAAASDIVTLFGSGTCSGYLKSDGSCDTPTGGYTNLTSFVGQTAWRLFYSNADGDVTELALGADGEYLKSNGASLAPSWATPSGAAHDAVTLSTDLGNNLLGLSAQQLTLDSQTANYIFAAPNSSAGVPSFRAMVDGDIPSAIARDSELPTASSLSVDDLITLSGAATGAVNLGSFTGATIDDNLTVKAALQDVETSFEAKLPAGTDGQYGVWLNDNTVNPNTYSTGKWGYTVYNNAPYWCYNGTCTAIPSAGFANPMTTAGDMIKGGASGAATRMVPGAGVVTALEATPNATGGILTHGSAPLAGIADSTTEALGAGSIELGHASDTTIARSGAGAITVEGVAVPTISSTSTLTNKTLDVEGTGNAITTVEKIWFAAAGCNNATAATFYDLPTSAAPAVACITGTNTQKAVLDFDAAADESGQVTLALPADFTGAIDVKYKWLAAATSGSVVWGVQTICVADAETDDPSFNTASTVTDAAKGTTLQTNDASITGVTATGCAAGELMHLRFFRDADNGSDNMTGDARLIGAEVTLRRAQ